MRNVTFEQIFQGLMLHYIICYVPLNKAFPLRTTAAMEQKRANIIRRKTREKEVNEVGSGERAVKRAKRAGVLLDLDLRCGYVPVSPHDDNWIFGPDKNKDNIYQAVPQVTLHGFDEGLVQKLNYGSLEMVIKFCLEELELPETQVTCNVCMHPICIACATLHLYSLFPMKR